ncbi:hypothetical protein BURPS668_A0402 [Burkholderia pseudomallei 668]|nr:hypothetical protein BURPS668_A0402 [Burkholderia pseudomallei 668]
MIGSTHRKPHARRHASARGIAHGARQPRCRRPRRITLQAA